MRYTRPLIVFMLLALMMTASSVRVFGQAANDAKPAYLDPSVSIEKRVDDLVSRMTPEEKASQLTHKAKAIPRLQVPAYNWWSEALHGVITDGVTVFPEPIGLAATFDAPLIKEMGAVIGTEGRAKYQALVRRGVYQELGLDFWSPNLNIFRDPRWGRGQETYGEDPYLTGRMGVAYVQGMQGEDPKYLRAIATPKHYAVHSGPEPLRHSFNASVTKHDMEDTYLAAFRAAVVEGKAGSVMCVYNSVNREPGCANGFLLGDQLRDKWGFRGYVVSDCGAVSDIDRGHHYTKTAAESAAVSLKRGTDLECADNAEDYSRYTDALKQGLITEKDLDVAVKRLMHARFALGMFDPPQQVPYGNIPMTEVDSPAHRQLAAKIARESMVLLKNDGTLPLKKDVKKIAVVGPLADSTRVMLGNYFGSNPKMVSALEGIRKQFANATVTFEPGTTFLRDVLDPIPEAVFSTPDGKPGLKAEYFKGMELKGTPAVTQVDKNINFEFQGDGAPGVGMSSFSVRWTGFLTPANSAVYRIGVKGDDGFRLWIDDKVIVEDWTFHAAQTRTAEVTLEKGRKYAVKLEYFQGGGPAVAKLIWQDTSTAKPESEVVQAAVDKARNADVIVAVVGINSDLEGEEMPVSIPGFKGGDRTSIDLPKEEEDLLKALKATGKPLVVVLMNGSALAVNWADKNANAILDAWYGGEEGGTAIAETLAGINNPAGRLPVTFYTGVEQLPPFEDYAMKGRTYRYFDGKPLYAFGHGLSYTTFSYSNLMLPTNPINAGDPLTVEVFVMNTGKVDGDEVVQLYLTSPNLPGAPLRALRSFKRVHLRAGEGQKFRFELQERDLSVVREDGTRVVGEGAYKVSIGGGQPNTGAPTVSKMFQVKGTKTLPE